MKKFLIGFVMLAVFAVGLPLAANAQTCRPKKKSYAARKYANRSYAVQGYSYQKPSFYRRHRNLMNIGIATAGGALAGGLIGGKRKSMLKGAVVGAGAGALYTFVLRPKKKRY